MIDAVEKSLRERREKCMERLYGIALVSEDPQVQAMAARVNEIDATLAFIAEKKAKAE